MQFKFDGKKALPTQGQLSNPNDAELVKGIEEQITKVHGFGVLEHTCLEAAAKPPGERWVRLENKVLTAVHMEPLIRACEKYEVEVLNILNNQTLGAEGGYALAKALSGSKSLKLTKLKCAVVVGIGVMVVAV